MRDRGVRVADELELVVVEVDAVREQRALVERAGAREARRDAEAVTGDGVALVDPSSAAWMWRPTPRSAAASRRRRASRPRA